MKKIAIIGVGPRGLSALECLFMALSASDKVGEVHVTLFEASPTPGSGSVWDTEQPATNWLNISERALQSLPERPEVRVAGGSNPFFSVVYPMAA